MVATIVAVMTGCGDGDDSGTSRYSDAYSSEGTTTEAGSGNDTSGNETSGNETSENDTSENAVDAAPDPATITISGFEFDGVTTVAVGTTVVVTNTDGAPHTWTALDGTFDSGSLGQGDSFEFTFSEAGTFDFQCSFHTSMTGTITVTG